MALPVTTMSVRRPCLNGRPAGEEVVEHGAEGEPVGRGVVRLPAAHLGRHVG